MTAFAPTVLLALTLVAAPAFIRTPLQKINIVAWVGSASNLTATPTAVTFPSSAPNNVVSVTGGVAWVINLALNFVSNWTLAVSAPSPTCTNAPLSSIAVHCVSVVDLAIALGPTHSCSPNITLSTSPQVIATGNDAVLIVVGIRTVTVQYTFSDLWKYTASSVPCNLSLSYVLTSL